MNPKDIFCPNIDCPARGQIGKGNIGIHSQAEKRYICDECQLTFTVTKGTTFYRLRTNPKIVLQVLARICFCSRPSSVSSYCPITYSVTAPNRLNSSSNSA